MDWTWCSFGEGDCYTSAAYDWQSLIGTVVAIAAAAIAIWAVNAQLRHSARQERDRLEARDRAARAVMPWALSEVVDYADRSATALMNLRQAQLDFRRAETGMATPPEKPELEQTQAPAELLPVFERLIEATQSQAVADRLADIIAELQVVDTRLKSDGRSTLNPRGLILGPLGLRAAAATLFQYARRETDSPPELTWAWVRNAAQLNPSTREKDWVLDAIANASDEGRPILAVEQARRATGDIEAMIDHRVHSGLS